MMADILELILLFILFLGLILAEHFTCTKLKSPIWGGVIPVAILAWSVWFFVSGQISPDMAHIAPFLILNIVFFFEWWNGRAKYSKLRQEEIEHMKAKDL